MLLFPYHKIISTNYCCITNEGKYICSMDVNFALADIDAAALRFAEAVRGHNVLAFHGEMGAGKTTFINAVCKTLGVVGVVLSPTFSIINQYATDNGAIIYHMDLYRLKNNVEAIDAGVEDALFSGHLCFVEWPEKAPDVLPDEVLHVNIISTGANTRKVSFSL
jgi:tRNA threonylcarbamoyladenosine biosynthesis protein TsaE